MNHLDMSLEEAMQWWDEVDHGGTDAIGIRTLCRIDRFYLLVKVCRRTDMLHPWVYARCREVEKSPDGHIDLWAREHFKSSIITFGGAIQAILNDPEITICIFSHINAIAAAFLKQIKSELESNTVLKQCFSDILYDDPAKQAKQWSIDRGITVKRTGNPKEATLEASGLVDGQPISKHFKLRIYDDVVTNQSVNTPEQIAKTTDAYSLSQSLGTENGREWVIGTRYSYADTYEWLLKRGALIPRVYAATDTGKPDGKLVLFSKKHWANLLKKSTDSDIACQYMQDPLSGQQRMFDINNLLDYEVLPAYLNVYVLCDPARSKKRGSDNTAIMVWGVDHALNKYLLDGFNHKMDLRERWMNFSRMYMRWKTMPGVVSVFMGYEEIGAQADLDYFEEQMRAPGMPKFEIKRLAWPRDGDGSKEDRVQRLGPDCKAHKIYLPYPTDPERLTANQRKMKDQGYSHRIARMIKRVDESGNTYNLADQLKLQFHYFPFGGKKDAIDASARIYDMEPKGPSMGEPSYLEPEYV